MGGHPIGDSEGIHGALALQLSADGINKVMTSDRNWADEGLGKTGETYLVGRDHLMRSISRELIEDPERFVKDVVANGTPQKVAERQVEVGDSVLLQPVRNAGVDMALAGETGATTDESYTGQVSLVASEPLGIPAWIGPSSLGSTELRRWHRCRPSRATSHRPPRRSSSRCACWP